MVHRKRVAADESTVRRFRRTIRLFERLLSFNLKDNSSCCGVTLAQCHTLLEIEELGEATAAVVADRLQLDRSTLSRTVDGLVTIGLVSRTTDPDDRRAIVLALTDQGKQVCGRINASNDRLFGKVLESLPDRAASLAAFERLAAALAQTMNGSAGCEAGCTSEVARATRRPRPRKVES